MTKEVQVRSQKMDLSLATKAIVLARITNPYGEMF